MEMLNEAMAKQRAEITRLRDVLHLTGTGKVLLALICLVLCYKLNCLLLPLDKSTWLKESVPYVT